MSRRFPLLADENVPGPLVQGLRSRGWDVVSAFEAFGQQSIDDAVFEHAATEGRVLVSTDTDYLAIARAWLDAGRAFRLIYWPQGYYQHVRVGRLLEAFEALASKEDAFAGCVEFLQIEP